MSFARKVKRANTPKEPRCCREKMTRKMGYDTDTHNDVVCDFTAGGCGAATGECYETPEEAADAWNRRVLNALD